MKNLKFRLQYAVLLLLILFARFSAFAQITPSQDSYINTASAATNFGSAATLGVVSSASSIQTTYIQFDLSSIPSSYKSSNVAKATLKLFVNGVSSNGSFNLDLVNGSWSEKTITGDLLPALGTTIKGSIPLTTANVNNYITIDLTTVAGEWLNGTQANDGIALVPNSGLSATFQSKENTNQSHPAELDIVFTNGATLTGITTASGSGLTGGGTSGTPSLSLLKTCSTNQVLQWNGSAWVCASVSGSTGAITGVTTASGSGLTGGGTSGAVSIGLQKTCSTSQVLQWNGSAWVCASAGTGTISGVTAGTGLSGGGNSGSITLNLDTTKVPQTGGNNAFTGTNTFTGNTALGTPATAVFQNGAGIGLEIQSLSTATGVSPALTVYEGSNNGSAILGNAPSANGVGVYATGGGAGLIANSAKTGVEGQTTTGTAGVFLATSGGKLLSGQNSLGEVFSVGSTGNVAGASGNFSGSMTVSSGMIVGSGAQVTNGSTAIQGNMSGNGSLTPAILGDALATGAGSTIGVEGLSSTTSGYGVYGDGGSSGTGVHGHSVNGPGVSGASTAGNTGGVLGVNSASGYGVLGQATGSSGQGVWGESFATSWSNGAGPDGVHGITHNNQGVGVSGTNTAPDGFGVWGSDPKGYGFVTDSHVSQARNMGGWAKAMVYADFTGKIYRCFNSQLAGSAASTAPCGITVTTAVDTNGVYLDYVDFGFEVDDRFVMLTFGYSDDGDEGYYLASDFGETAARPSPSQVLVFDKTFRDPSAASSFYVIVF